MKTIVYQSHALEKMVPWLRACTSSVEAWTQHISAEYRFLGDELFDLLPPVLREKYAAQPVILSDLARLRLLLGALQEGYERAVWLDADILVFAPERFVLPKTTHVVGREVWVQRQDGKLRAYRKVHNALLMTSKGDSFLPFYADAAECLLERAVPPLVPQFIGPKFLTAQHNIVGLHVCESVGMLSALALKDAVMGGGPALDLTVEGHEIPPAAFNLSASYAGKESDGICNSEADYEAAVEALLAKGCSLLSV